MLRRAGKPPVIAVNKVDSPNQSREWPRRSTSLATKFSPSPPNTASASTRCSIRSPPNFPKGESVRNAPDINIAIIGRPNVGKSTLLNQLVGAERSIVSPEPGTTRDTVDTVVERHGKTYRFLDTAGIRRKGKTKLIAEKLSVIMARRHLERADIAVLVVDASVGRHLARRHHRELCRAIRPLGNYRHEQMGSRTRGSGEKAAAEKKHGLKGAGANPSKLLADYEPIVRAKLKFLSYAPIVFLSALTGDRVEKLYTLLDRVAVARERRVSTGELNRWLSSVDLERGTSPADREVKIFYITQATVAPPTFVLFTNQLKPLHFSYQRFLENRLRNAFDFLARRFASISASRNAPLARRTSPRGEDRATIEAARAPLSTRPG